ncbi:CapA family protein [Qipengyuania sp. 6B39]|uniref:CapA family protein n=1 Tax=Qipengyuania proteolytica TaxID=2867239 RepID=UPI001C8B0A1F|nr:CapA family protein [Qipengyuania proteolytica]MBX7496293.1 CapA family protein [Qipengyuania proteolytica]
MPGWTLKSLIAGAALCVAASLAAHPEDMLVGGAQVGPGEIAIAGLLDGRRDKVDFEAVTVSINGQPVELRADGHFGGTFPISPYYRVDIAGPGIFAMVQTFGNGEVRDEACDCLVFPAIELVARRKGRIELFFGGDSMAGRRFFEAPRGEQAVLDRVTLDRDLDRLFTAIKPYLETSDLASINLESVVAAEQPGPPAPKKYLFFSPPELPMALARAGIDHVSLGNNHTADYRDAGMRTTLDALDAAGVKRAGAGMDVAEAERAARFTVSGQKLGIFGFVGWRGTWTPNQTATETKSGAAWGKRSDVERVTTRERRAGYIPIMHFHGNMEYADRPSEMSIPRYRAAIEKGAPLVIGHHPHVTHGLEIYRGGLIAHSLGNFLFDQEHPHTHVTYTLKVWLENGKFLRAEVIPIQMLDYRPVPAVGTMREAVLRRVSWLSSEMGTVLARSGGHMAVWREQPGVRSPACRTPEAFTLTSLAPACPSATSQYGRNLIPRGDFENTRVGEAADRFWMTLNAGLDFRESADGGGYMALLPESGSKAAYLYSRSYIRDVEATDFTLQARITLPRSATVELIVKERPQEDDEASPSVRGETIANKHFAAGAQDLSFDFSRPPEVPGKARAFRLILRVDFDDRAQAGDRVVEIDDLALVEWPLGEAQGDPAQAWRWTHSRPHAAPHLAGK